MNECSGAMVHAFSSIVEQLVPQKRSLEFFPYISFPLADDWDLAARLKPQTFPFVDDSPGLLEYLSSPRETTSWSPFSVQYGDFIRMYSGAESRGRFDAVVTCFFVDTAVELFDYLAVIRRVLRPGGLWINSGPLHYHHRASTPYSYTQFLQIVSLYGFESVSQTRVRTNYCGDSDISMKPETYSVPLGVFRLRDGAHLLNTAGPQGTGNGATAIYSLDFVVPNL